MGKPIARNPKSEAEVLQRKIDKVLSDFFWPPNLKIESYTTTHDDNDGDPASGFLTVSFSKDGDAWIQVHGSCLRFRTWGGGGRFLKVRNALLLLADAIRQEGIPPSYKKE